MPEGASGIQLLYFFHYARQQVGNRAFCQTGHILVKYPEDFFKAPENRLLIRGKGWNRLFIPIRVNRLAFFWGKGLNHIQGIGESDKSEV